MAILNWSTISSGQDITAQYNPLAGDVLNFDDPAISAGDRGSQITWSGNFVTMQAGGKTFTFTVAGGGRALTTSNVTFANGSQLIIGDNTTGTSGDDLGNFLTGTAGSDRILGLGGDDTLQGGQGNDVFLLNNGGAAFGNDSIQGGQGQDFIGIGVLPAVTAGGTIDFELRTVVSAQGTATFKNIENAFGTLQDDSFYAYDPLRVYGGFANGPKADFARLLEGNAGDDYIEGDPRAGMYDVVRYSLAQTGVLVDLAQGYALDGQDNDTIAAGIQQGVDTIVGGIEGVQGSPFDDTLLGGGSGVGFNGLPFASLEGRAGNDLLDANGMPNVRADYINSPSGVTVNLLAGTAQDGWDSDTVTGGVQPYTDTLIGITFVGGSSFADILAGDAADNVLEGRAGDDTLDGGAGNDVAVFSSATAGISVDLATGTANLSAQGLGIDTLIGIEGLRGGDFADTLTGADGVDNFFQGKAGADLLDGRTGNDRARYDEAPSAVDVDLALGTALDGYDSDSLTGGVQAYQDTLVSIEKVRGSLYDDTIGGDAGANSIEGWGGNDLLDGGLGVDLLEFGLSPGGAIIDLGSGVVASDGWGGSDTVSGFEQVEGSAAGDSIVGGAGAETLVGGAGNDTLVGGAGLDSLAGGPGDDYYVVDDASGAAEVSEAAGEGRDTISAGVGITLPAEVEGFVFTGSGGIAFSGNALDNVVAGGAFDDTLTGGGGEDTVSYAYETNPVTIDLAAGTASGSGNDALSGFDNAKGGQGDDSLVGNASGNVLDGNAGADTLAGGAGNDMYVVDSLGDAVVESSNAAGAAPPGALAIQGIAGITDTVLASIDYSLANIANVENLTLQGGATSGTGNALANELVGNALNNTLAGLEGADSILGAAGADVLRGGADGDTLRGGGGGDEIRGGGGDDFQYAGGGNDSLYGGPGSDTSRGGPQADVLRSGGGNDTVYGGAGNDTLYGGPGNDALTGGADADRFMFNFAPDEAGNADTLADFASGADLMVLDPAVFAALAGGIGAGNFVSGAGATAQDADDYLVYDTAGHLYYDADGSSGGAAAMFAHVAPGTPIAFGDFALGT